MKKKKKNKGKPQPKKPQFRQCVLHRLTGEGEAIITSYLPEKYAVVNKVVKLKGNQSWTDGWVVKSAGELVDEPPDYRKAIRRHRKNTGDDTPKVPDEDK
jgi:hypothetical protein